MCLIVNSARGGHQAQKASLDQADAEGHGQYRLGLEPFHSLINWFAPKSIGFPQIGLRSRYVHQTRTHSEFSLAFTLVYNLLVDRCSQNPR